MATYSHRISKLEAVNTMLTLVGDAPVNSLIANTASSQIAELILDEVTKEVQHQGWHFNTESGVTLPRENDGKIAVPDNALSIDVDPITYPDIDIVIRGDYLYDKKNHTYTFSSDLSAEIVSYFSWEELPEIAKRYIVLRAGRIFSQRIIGSAEQTSANTIDENQALRELSAWDNESADYNIFSEYSVARILDR
jgi:Tail tubular protein